MSKKAAKNSNRARVMKTKRVKLKGEKGDGPNPRKLGPDDFDLVADLLRATGGIKSQVARRLNIDRSTLQHYIDRTPAMQVVLDDINEMVIDLAESNIFESLQKKDKRTTRWFLQWKGAGRGYGKQINHSSPDGSMTPRGTHIDLSGVSDETLAQLHKEMLGGGE